MLNSEYREKLEIMWMWTRHGKIIQEDDGFPYSKAEVGDWFDGEIFTLERAAGASTEEEADRILSDAYLGSDRDGIGVHWEIRCYFPGRLS